jgi:hypothetical protein
MRLLVCCLAIAGVIACAAEASAGEPRIAIPGEDSPGCGSGESISSPMNQSGEAWLSWDAHSEGGISNLALMPAAYRYLYVQLANLDEVAACELRVRWSPPSSASDGCYALIRGLSSDGSVGPDGQFLGGPRQKNGPSTVVQSGENYWREVFVWDKCMREATAGPLTRALFNFSHCNSGVPGKFHLEYCKVTDCEGRITDLAVTGAATILGGASLSAPLPVESTTWGSVKLLYASH